ncbi:uncharacterized protein [Petaurus breviceps papuanus]|uniref:uncharacterized protein isoform X2 n=1 Tax=Petaurus breviceps papuanus TaxID=3040969 RepID=UPI0036DAC5E0
MIGSPSSSALPGFLAEARADHPLERGIQELSLGDQDALSSFYQPENSELGERPASPKSLNLPATGSASRDSGSPITMESDLDLTSNLLLSGGMPFHCLTLRTPVTESTPDSHLPNPSNPGSPSSQEQDMEGVSSCTLGSKALSLTSTLPFNLGTSRSILLEPRKSLRGDPAPEKSWGQTYPWAGAPSLSPNSRLGPVSTTLLWVRDKPWTLPTDSSMLQREAAEAPRASPMPVGVLIKDPTGMIPGGQGGLLGLGAELQGRQQEGVSSEVPGEEAREGEDGPVDRRSSLSGEDCKKDPQKLKLGLECWVSSLKPSVEDSYGRQVREAGCMLLEWFRCLFLDSDNHSFSLLDSGLALTAGGLPLNAGSQEHPVLRGHVAFLTMRNGRKLGMTFPGSNLFYYYSLGRHFFVTAQLNDHWFRVRDRVTGEQMLMKKVPVVSDWQKMLHHFLFLPPGPGLLVPYAVLYDRQGSLLYLMEDPGVLTVGWPPAGQQLDRLKCLLEIHRFLKFCQHQGLQLEEVDSGLLYTHQGIHFDPSGLSSNEGPYVFRKTFRNALRLVWNTPQEDIPAAEALLEQMWTWLEEDIKGNEEVLDEARASSLDPGTP